MATILVEGVLDLLSWRLWTLVEYLTKDIIAMLFITNREPKGSSATEIGRPYKFDLDKNSPSSSVYYCDRVGKNKYVEIGSKELMNRLRLSDAKQLLFFIHGFSNLPEPDVFPRVQKLQQYFDHKEKGLVSVIPLV